jgi:hypothetical protein
MQKKLKDVESPEVYRNIIQAIFCVIPGMRFLASGSIFLIAKPNNRNYLVLPLVILYFSGFTQNTVSETVKPIYPESTENQNSKHVCKKSHQKPSLIAKLPSGLKETSGLVMFDGLLWTINDGGNPAEIYLVDTVNGQILRTVKINNAPNYDWESLTQDDSNVFIGDFGNNSGSRTNLQILKLGKQKLRQSAVNEIEAQFIRFYYPDQANFTPKFNNNNFDCEAFFFYNDSLHLFSKNWADGLTKHYTLPIDSGTYEANLKGGFNANGLITDASINQNGNIILLGYKKTRGKPYTSFAWLFTANNGTIPFNGQKRRLEFGSVLRVGQTEGIFLKNDNSALISSESILNGLLLRPAKLQQIDLDACFQE